VDHAIIWNVVTRKVECSAKISDANIGQIAWSPDGVFLAASGWGGGSLIDTRDGKIVSGIPTLFHGDAAVGPTWLGRNDHFLCAFGSGTLANAETKSGGWSKWSWVMTKWPSNRRLVCVSPDGKRFATVGRTLRVWNMREHALVSTHSHSFADVRAIDWSSDGLVALAGGGGVRVFDMNGAPKERHFPLSGFVHDVKWSPDGRTLAIALAESPKPAVFLWHSENDKEPREAIEGTARPEAIAWSNDGSHFAVGWNNGDITIMDATSDRPPRKLADTTRRGVTGLAWLPNDRLLVLNWNDQATSFDASSGNRLGVAVLPKSAHRVAAVAANSSVVLFGPQGAVLWDGVSATELFSDNCSYGCLTPDGKTFLASIDERVVAWDLESREPRYSHLDWQGQECVFVRPDGQWSGPEGVEQHIVYVALTDDGKQITMKPTEFAAKYGAQYVPAVSKADK
jgi:WD40 repeat protein